MSTDSSPDSPQHDPADPRPGRVIVAHYIDGAIRPDEPLDLPEGTAIQLIVPTAVTLIAEPLHSPAVQPAPAIVQPALAADAAAEAPSTVSAPRRSLLSWLEQPLMATGWLAAVRLRDALLLGGGALFYTLTRLIGLVLFPIYFFCDEAIQSTLARQLLSNGLRDADGNFLPPYFLNAEKWNLSLSIYVHAISTVLFGSSVWLTRATSVAVSLLAVFAVALTMRMIFQSRFWWVAPLVLATLPSWFLHSRTAFETVMMVSFYACFLCCYLLYRLRNPNWLFPALIFGGMTFYAYANGQGVMLVSGVLLLLIDIRYHLRQGWAFLLGAAGLLMVLVVPLLRFRLLEPEAYTDQLRALDSYWMRPFPLSQKISTFLELYFGGMSPTYWFLPNTVDLERHRMFGMGHLPIFLLPFVLIGLGVCLWRWRSPAHRTILVALLAAPFSAALVGLSITRVLAMVIPATLFAVLGFEQVYTWLSKRMRYTMAAGIVAVGLGLSSLLMLRTALADGPTWYTDYGLSGMQYGAQQLFGEAIPEILLEEPTTELLVSPTWANNPNSFLDFFLSPAQTARVQLINIDAFTVTKRDLNNVTQLFVMPDYEYQRAQQSGKFIIETPDRIIPYPDGRPGFYFVRMRYVDNVDAIFEADRIARAQLVETQAEIDQQPLTVAHSQLDMGAMSSILDGDTNTLLRGFEANPFIMDLRFAQPRQVAGITLTVGTMDMNLRLIGTPADGGEAIRVEQEYRGLPVDPTVTLDLPPGTPALSSLRIEIEQIGAGDIAHIHVRELGLR